MFAQTIARLVRDRKGAAAMVYALLTVPIILSIGAAVDYARIEQFKTQLQTITDAAALAGAAVYFDTVSGDNAAATATNYFNTAVAGLPAHDGNISPNVTLAPITVNSQYGYGVTVRATGTIDTTLLRVVEPTAQISATSVAAIMPLNIDFYLLLDDSPSMAIAATAAGITTMVNNTPQQGGCAFACHESNPAADNLGNPNGEDNYALARDLGVTLRIDMLQQATANLVATAQSTELSSGAAYRMAIYTFDYNFNTIEKLNSNLTSVKSGTSNIQLLEVYKQEWLTSTLQNGDADTNFDQAMTDINSLMPPPGHGTNSPGDSPQEVLFFVTDGVEDENVSGNRQVSLMDPAQCTTIKNRGIRIAVLYTTYLPLPTNDFYNTNVAPFQPQIASDLEQCASPGLYFQVNSGEDISNAMGALFQKAISPVAFLVR